MNKFVKDTPRPSGMAGANSDHFDKLIMGQNVVNFLIRNVLLKRGIRLMVLLHLMCT